jgi:hypothetical protein
LGLPVYHILEERVRAHVPEEIYAEKLQMMEMVLDLPRIESDLAEMRAAG